MTELWNLYGPRFISGAAVTLEITVVSVLIGLAIGVPTALVRLYGPRWLRAIAVGYIELFRGTPLLVQLFVVYYGLPSFGIAFDSLIAAFITIGLNSGAFQAEYFRGAIRSVEAGQMTAARAVGLTRLQGMLHVVLPQAARIVLPAWSNEVIGVMKASAVVFLISVEDLMAQAKIIFGRTFNPIQAYAVATLVYLVLISVAVLLLSRVERRARIPGVGVWESGR